MEVHQLLHMNGGVGETSYAKNSAAQNKVISMAEPIMEEAIRDLYQTSFPKTISIADLGCSSGPNALFAVSKIIDMIEARCRHQGCSSPEFQVFLNDLPGNDFNTLFKSLPAFYEKQRQEKGEEKFRPCFVAGVPGSFYGRLFPACSLHFVHSSSSLHWLSQVPPELNNKAIIPLNKGKIYISRTSPPAVLSAYLTQFQRDFNIFLKSRSEEIVTGGRMVLTFRGRRAADPTTDESCYLWNLLAQAIGNLGLEGSIEEQKVDSYNAPYYEASSEEIKTEIEKEGSFSLDRLEMIETGWDEVVERLATIIRAIQEPMLASHFGEEIMDRLFERFGEILATTSMTVNHFSFVISMTRNA